MKKIVFGITGLTLGGAERVLVDIANAIKDEYNVTIFTLYGGGELEQQLDPCIKRVTYQTEPRNRLSKLAKIKISFLFRFGLLRNRIYNHYIKGKYDVEVAFLEGPITWLFSAPSESRKLVWVHNDIKEVFGKGLKANQKKHMNNRIYHKYDEIIFVSKDNETKFNELYPNNKVPKRVIYNYLDQKMVLEKAQQEKISMKHDLPSFVQVSRLTEQKGVSRLIDVHKKLIQDGYLHHIYIIGTGPLETQLKEQVLTSNIEETFHLLGKMENPYPYILSADYFLLTSLYEGYGMVIDEAKILDKFVMITDTAAREAVLEYENSLIVTNSPSGIYDGLKKLITKEIKTKKIISSNKKNIIKDIEKVIEGD